MLLFICSIYICTYSMISKSLLCTSCDAWCCAVLWCACVQIIELAGYTARASGMFRVFEEVRQGNYVMTSTVSRNRLEGTECVHVHTHTHTIFVFMSIQLLN